ncbi:creatininase family protein [Halorussus amylolyticus]|uniref:creatininase family protein n=1 Tax=Halorussus amylolyticus TaxID=1126242 RepID=UPI00104D8635|nr:creatininase family protein [Halorussus amylolyticus]
MTRLDAGPAALATKTRLEIDEVASQSGSVLVVPVGSVEQHGHHLPVATDTLLADAVANLGAERVADDQPTLVAPPVWTGYSPHHLSLGGTITADADQLIELLESVADSAAELGFDAVLLVNGHGGNGAAIDVAVSTIGDAHPDLEVAGLTYFELAAPFADEIRDSDTGGMAHGGEFETSLLLHLHPELVGEDADAEYLDDPYDRGTKDLLEGGPVTSYTEFEEYSESGAIGDPDLASAEKGEELFDRIGDELADVLRTVHEQAVEK